MENTHVAKFQLGYFIQFSGFCMTASVLMTLDLAWTPFQMMLFEDE